MKGVKEIRKLFFIDGIEQKLIAKKVDISYSHINRIINNIYWRQQINFKLVFLVFFKIFHGIN